LGDPDLDNRAIGRHVSAPLAALPSTCFELDD
jgi:hypothetical protein